MVSAGAWASFLTADSPSIGMIYKVRFNGLAAKAFGEYEYVSLQKTENHIIVTPLTNWQADGDKRAYHIVRDRNGGVLLGVTGLVNREQFISPDLFGKRYRVKRGRGDNKIYICLREEV